MKSKKILAAMVVTAAVLLLAFTITPASLFPASRSPQLTTVTVPDGDTIFVGGKRRQAAMPTWLGNTWATGKQVNRQ